MVRESLQDLWATDISDYFIAGVPDYNVIFRGRLKERFGDDFKVEEYVNSGVLLINNKKWREENLFEKLLDYSVKNASLLQYPDQDAINFICREHKKMLPDYYNVRSYFYTIRVLTKLYKPRKKQLYGILHPGKRTFLPRIGKSI